MTEYPVRPLREIVTVEKGKNPNKNSYSPSPTPNAQTPVITAARGPAGFIEEFTHEGEMLTMSTHGDAGFVNYWSGKQYLGGNVIALRPINPEEIHLRYLYHALRAQYQSIKSLVRTGGVPYISVGKILDNIKVPVPPHAKQVEVSDHLDVFLLAASNLEQQAKNLRDQYEYYAAHNI